MGCNGFIFIKAVLQKPLDNKEKREEDWIMDKETKISAIFNEEQLFFIDENNNKHRFEEGCGPYHFLLGALSGCFYMTLREIANKMKVSFSRVEIDISCTKRQSAPTTMDYCLLKIRVVGVEEKAKFESACEKTSRYCSIFQTLKQVATMEYEIEFL